jgi:energy-coupling factor transporter ATP-binding protein EcfA2
MQLCLADLIPHLEQRLRNGEHLALYGPRGSGKSTLLSTLELRLRRTGVPCAVSVTTTSLDHITRALERAYPSVETSEVARRTARARLWMAADQHAGVLLLDHLCDISNAMVSFLRRLHGKVIGVLSAVDVDDPRERQAMKPWRYGAMSIRMPPTSTTGLRRLLRARCKNLQLPPMDARVEHRLLKAARGRPGWIVKCTELERESCYWHEEDLFVTVLCVDTEAAVRYRALHMLRPPSGTSAR